MAPHVRLLTAALALTFLGVHALSLPRSLEDIDSINFALGVESFDVAAHRPHPPGYPVFVALAKVSTAALSIVASGWDRTARAAVGLSIWGVLAGTVFAWALVRLWTTLRWPPVVAWSAALLAVTTPLFWFTSARPLSDATALVAAVAVQWALLRGWRGLPGSERVRAGSLLAAACAAGICVGLRTQTMWLTGPVLGGLVLQRMRAGEWSRAASLVGAAAVGSLLWAVPLIWNTGGVDAYIEVLTDQGEEDFAEVRMLATTPTLRVLTDASSQMFLAPWRVRWLGQLMAILALIGTVRLMRRDRRGLAIVAVAYVPYIAFGLLFQEADTARYALPAVVPVAALAALALGGLPTSAALVSVGVVGAASIWTGQTALRPYGDDVPPTFLAFRDAKAAAAAMNERPLVVAHDSMRRVADWYRPEWPDLPAQRPREREWLRIVEHFRAGGTQRAWFMADRRRSDAALFDPRSRTLLHEYLHEHEIRRLVGRLRPDEVRWWEIRSPNWMLGSGWALSPEIAGRTAADRQEPHQAAARGYLRRDQGAHRILLGGRYLSGSTEGWLIVEIDGREMVRWPVSPTQPWFLHWMELPDGAIDGAGPYATLAVRVESSTGTTRDVPRVGLEQFDFASADALMVGLAQGWHEAESNQQDGLAWRWTSARSVFAVHGGEGRPAKLFLAGESPLRYFSRPSIVSVSIDGYVVRRFTATDDFREVIHLPAGALGKAPAEVVVETDQTFVPADRGESDDRRKLGLRLVAAEIRHP